MPVILKNNVVGFLAQPIGTNDVSLELVEGTGVRFPTLGLTDYFYATVQNLTGNFEIIRCTARVGDVLTIERAQEGTTASAFPAGSRIQIRVTAQAVLDAILTSNINFDSVYQGPSATDPVIRVDGAPLQTGDLYFNTTSDELRVYNGLSWIGASLGSITVDSFTGTGAQTDFTLSVSQSLNNTQVYINGVYQNKSTYTITGTLLSFSEAPALDDDIEVVSIKPTASTNIPAADIQTTNPGADEWSNVQEYIDYITSGLGASKVGYTPAGTGAVATTVQAKLRESISISDRATPASNGISNVVTDLKAAGGGSFIAGAESYTLTSGNSLSITGGVSTIGAIAFDGKYARVTSPDTSTNAYDFSNVPGSIAPTYRSEFSIKNLSATGAGQGGTSAGIFLKDIADVRIEGAIARNFAYGFRGESALSCDFRDMTFTENSIGISAVAGTGLTLAEPNALRFYGARVYGNERAVATIGGPNAAMLWASCNFEGNNLSGNDADGRAVISNVAAGEQVYICTHHEGNLGQYGTYFQGADFTKTMTFLGVQHIDGTDEQVHIESGCFLGLGSRINQAGSTNDLFLDPGTSATLIETETRQPGGDVSNLMALRFGKLGFGQIPVRSSPCITANNAAIANAAGNVVSRFSSDVTLHRWADSADVDIGYEGWYKVFDTEFVRNGLYGFGFFSNAVKILNVGRTGNLSIEPGSDNTINLGGGALRWKEIFSANAVINTSDARLKTDDRPLSEKERAVAVKAKGLLKAFRFKESVKEKGDKARIHFGVYAQELKEAFESEGLVAEDYAVLCYDEWDEIPEQKDDDGNIKQPFVPAGNQYGVRYEELMAFILAAL